jgi:hypothetical protein
MVQGQRGTIVKVLTSILHSCSRNEFFSEYLWLYSMLEDLEIPYILDVTKYEMLEDNIKEHIKRVGQEIYNRERS